MRGGLILTDKAFREKSKIGEINIPISDIKPTQFQLYLDRIFNPDTQEGIPGLVKLIKKGVLGLIRILLLIFEKIVNNTYMDKKLQQKILKMAACDQKLRRQAIKNNQNKILTKQVYDCDTKNILEAKKIIKKYSWPIFNLVGKKASHGFWLLVQHADRDTKFQKKCLKLLKEASSNNQVHLQNVAFLTDRILIAEKKKQEFGTQYMMKDNKPVIRPVVDAKNLNKRRIEYGLNTAEEQTKIINKRYAKILKK